jgi:hypothetical protein
MDQDINKRVVEFMVNLQRVHRHLVEATSLSPRAINDSTPVFTESTNDTTGAEPLYPAASFGAFYEDARTMVDNVLRKIGYAKSHYDFYALNDAEIMLIQSAIQYQLQEWTDQLPPIELSTSVPSTFNGTAPFNEAMVYQYYELWVKTKVFEYEVQTHVQRLVEFYGMDHQNVSSIFNLVNEFSDMLEVSIKGLNPELQSSISQLSVAHSTFETETSHLEPQHRILASQIPV